MYKSSITITMIILCLSAFFLFSCNQDHSKPVSPDKHKITIGCAKGNSPALLYLAKLEKFYDEASLEVEIKEYQSGVAALKAYLNNEVELVTASEFAFVSKSFDIEDLYIIASIAKFRNKAVIARKDAKITKPEDLAGKKIAVTPKSGGEYFLGQFLARNNIQEDSFETVPLKTKAIVEQLISGNIHAAATWEPNVYHLKKLLAENSVVWEADKSETNFLVIMTNEGVIKNKKEALVRLIQALRDTNNQMEKHPEIIGRFLQEKFLYEKPYLESILMNTDYNVSLSKELLEGIIEKSRWRVLRGLSKADIPIDYRQKIITDIIEEVDPKLMTIQ